MPKFAPSIEVPYTHTLKSGRKVQAYIKLIMFENRMSFIHKKPSGGTELANFPSKPFEALLDILFQRNTVKSKTLK